MSQTQLEIWMYQLLLGTLSRKKKEQLKKLLAARMERMDAKNPLESLVLTAMTVKRPFKEYMERELRFWEIREKLR